MRVLVPALLALAASPAAAREWGSLSVRGDVEGRAETLEVRVEGSGDVDASGCRR